MSGPVKEIVHYVLFLGPQKVKLPGTERDTGSTTENEPDPREKPGTAAFAARALRSHHLSSKDVEGHMPLPTRECAQVKEKGARTSLLPCIGSRAPVKSHSGPPVGAFSPHPQAARWFPERTLERRIA